MPREEWEESFIERLRRTGEQDRSAREEGVAPRTVRHHKLRDQEFRERVECLRRSLRRGGMSWLLLAAVIAAPAFATITSAPVQLGATGLSLTVGLLSWDEDAPDDWTTASTAGVTVEDLGGGQYLVHGLPAATGTDRYAVTVYVTGDTARGLQSYVYGAQPGQRVVWREELALPNTPLVFKEDDTAGSVSLVVLRRLPAAACAGGTAVTFSAALAQTNAALFSNRAAVLSDCALDATTGTYGATLTYDIQSGDLATPGKYLGEFKVCYSLGSCQTLPSDNRLGWTVTKRLGG